MSRLTSIVELTEAEHRLAADGPVEDLAGVQAALAAELNSLPSDLDEAERGVLVAVHGLRERTIELLRTARDEAAAEVAKLDHGRTAMRGYVPAGLPSSGGSVDTAV